MFNFTRDGGSSAQRCVVTENRANTYDLVEVLALDGFLPQGVVTIMEPVDETGVYEDFTAVCPLPVIEPGAFVHPSSVLVLTYNICAFREKSPTLGWWLFNPLTAEGIYMYSIIIRIWPNSGFGRIWKFKLWWGIGQVLKNLSDREMIFRDLTKDLVFVLMHKLVNALDMNDMHWCLYLKPTKQAQRSEG